mgnify:CR=1 FL=1
MKFTEDEWSENEVWDSQEQMLMCYVPSQGIEIVKGAASALYGSNATGGVINIITKRSQKPWTINVNARYAKHNEQRYGASFGLNGKHWNNMLTANFNRIDNYDVHSAENPVTRVISTIYGDKTMNFKEQLVWSPTQNFSLAGRAGYFFRETVRSADQPERYRDFTGGLRILFLGRKGLACHSEIERLLQTFAQPRHPCRLWHGIPCANLEGEVLQLRYVGHLDCIGKAVKVNAALDNLFGYKPKYYYLNSPLTDGVTFQIA